MKVLSKILLVVYLLVLFWLLLFKISPDWSLAIGNTQSLNLIPFATYSRENPVEMILNLLAFIPFGLLLSVSLKRTGFMQKLAFVFIFSMAAEIAQFALGVGVTDITDVITNTTGGFLGLAAYAALKKHYDTERIDKFMTVIGAMLIVLSIVLLGIIMSRGIRYQSAPPPGSPRLRR